MTTLGSISLLDFRIPTRFDSSSDTTYIAMRPLVEGLGLAWKPQYLKLMASYKYAGMVRELRVKCDDGKHRRMVCLPRDHLGNWLRGLAVDKVKPAARERIERGRRQVANERRRLLEWLITTLREEHFGGEDDRDAKELTQPPTAFETGLIDQLLAQPDASLDEKMLRILYPILADQIAAALETNQ